MPTPPVIRRGLAAELRELRGEMPTTALAEALNVSHTKISKIESAERAPSLDDVVSICDVLGVGPGPERDRLIDMARRSRRTLGWWHPWRDLAPSWLRTLLRLSAECVGVDVWEPDVVHGLVQTADYGRALTRATLPTARADDVERRVELRLARQAVTADRELWIVLGEPAVRRVVGGPEIMAAQLDHLIQRSNDPGVTVQVLPLAAGPHPGLSGGFELLRFPAGPGRESQDVVYGEYSGGAYYAEDAGEVEAHARTLHHMRALAATPEASREIMQSIREEITRG